MHRDPSRDSARGPGAHFGFLASPPPLPRIVARAQVFCALLLRAALEDHPDRDEAAAIATAQREWLVAAGAADELEPPEQALLAAACGELPDAERERCGWLGEAALMLAWALRRTPLPAPGESADASRVATGLGFLDDSGLGLGSRAQLRPRNALLAAVELVDVAGARLAQALEAPARVSLARWRSPGYTWPEGVVPFEFADDDLALGGRPLSSVPAPRLLSAWRRTHERRCAGLWLLGAARRYSEVAAIPGV